jgi:hypothetical protein
MMAAKIQFIGEAQHSEGVSWRHFHCPDGTIAEIIGPQFNVRQCQRIGT